MAHSLPSSVEAGRAHEIRALVRRSASFRLERRVCAGVFEIGHHTRHSGVGRNLVLRNVKLLVNDGLDSGLCRNDGYVDPFQKLQHRRAFPGKNPPNAAPVLAFHVRAIPPRNSADCAPYHRFVTLAGS